MVPIFTTMSAFLLRPLAGLKSAQARGIATKVLKARFDPDHVFLARDEEHFARGGRTAAADSRPMHAGTTPGRDGADPVAWREWAWTDPVTLGACTFSEIRWRFYANGRIAFQAEMANERSGLTVGALQGHRIELRTVDGCLLGAWKAAFVVRRSSGIRFFPATIEDAHPLVALHFDELAERQSGACYLD